MTGVKRLHLDDTQIGNGALRFSRRRLGAQGAAASLLLAAHAVQPAAAFAADGAVPDWEVPEGHFYTQAVGPGDGEDVGFVISDTGGI
ncbi:MAG TPA: hypothetical protein VGW38_13845, partial [Chloroflexota bacterium]|nr:hypothetical protein [Chloroflexota bacterium]